MWRVHTLIFPKWLRSLSICKNRISQRVLYFLLSGRVKSRDVTLMITATCRQTPYVRRDDTRGRGMGGGVGRSAGGTTTTRIGQFAEVTGDARGYWPRPEVSYPSTRPSPPKFGSSAKPETCPPARPYSSTVVRHRLRSDFASKLYGFVFVRLLSAGTCRWNAAHRSIRFKRRAHFRAETSYRFISVGNSDAFSSSFGSKIELEIYFSTAPDSFVIFECEIKIKKNRPTIILF